jgi:hypothetical protein
MKFSFDITDFEVKFSQETEEFYIDSQDFKLALAEDISNCDVIESKISIKFEGEIRNLETVLGKSYRIGKYGEEREEVLADCEADLSRWKDEKGKIIFNTSVYLD